MSLRRIIDTFKGLNEPEPEDDEDDGTESCFDRSWDEYPHWAWKVPSKAIVAARAGRGVLLFYAGPHFRYQVEEEPLECLDDLGLDKAPLGISVWEGVYITEAGATWDGETSDESMPKGEFRLLTEMEWDAVRKGMNPWDDASWRGKREGDKRCDRCQCHCTDINTKAPVVSNCDTCAWCVKPVHWASVGLNVASPWKCSRLQGERGDIDMPTRAWRMMSVNALGRPTESGCPGYMADNLREDCFSCHWAKIGGTHETGMKVVCNTPKHVGESADWSKHYRGLETGLPFQDGTPPPCPGYSRRK